MTNRQELIWVDLSRKVPLQEKPKRVWSVIGQKPELPMNPVHGITAFLEDQHHDWSWSSGVFRYFSRFSDGNVWVLLEY